MVGDADQLPPVEAGEPFRDLIDSSIIPVTRLERIYRTEEGGDIHELCNGIRNDESPVVVALNEDGNECLVKVTDFPDIIFFPETENDAIAAIACEHYKELIEEGAWPDEIMMLTPFNSREHIGSTSLNARIRYDVLGRGEDRRFLAILSITPRTTKTAKYGTATVASCAAFAATRSASCTATVKFSIRRRV